MKRQMQWLWALVAAIAPVLAWAQTVQRPIEDFVSTQGTYCLPDGSGGCLYFVPPVANFIGWGSQAHFGQFASIDYAGLANRYIETASSGDDLHSRAAWIARARHRRFASCTAGAPARRIHSKGGKT